MVSLIESAPRTAVAFECAGVVFTTSAGETRCAGPAGKRDLFEALRAEVQRRADVIGRYLAINGRGARVLLILPPPAARISVCVVCGDPLPRHRGGDCALCRLALARALRTAEIAS